MAHNKSLFEVQFESGSSQSLHTKLLEVDWRRHYCHQRFYLEIKLKVNLICESQFGN